MEIGSGHVMRCLTLAGRLRARGDMVRFVSRGLPGNLIALVERHGFQVMYLPHHAADASLTGYAAWLTVPQEVDAAETCAILEDGQIDLLVVDSYALDITWEHVLRPRVLQILVIDDIANRRHDCDYLLDQNFFPDGGQRYQGLVPPACQPLLGPRYALLREEFYAARSSLPARTGFIRHLLVFYGGADRTDETSKAVRALLALRAELQAGTVRSTAIAEDFTADVIVGASNVWRKAVKALCEGHDWLRYHCQVDDMADFMARADLMLGAGGTTTWERCYLGLPALVTAVADNQVQGCDIGVRAGIYIYLGLAAEVTELHIRETLRMLQPETMRAQSVAGLRMMAENTSELPF